MAQVLEKIPSEVSCKRELKKLTKKIKTCELCENLVKTRNQSVMGYGDFNADIFIIGEAPGRLGADITGVPFTKDRSGMLLQKMLCNLGLNRSEPECTHPKLSGVYITNIVRCNPQDGSGTNRSPTKMEINNCVNYIEKELDIIKPRLVISLGLPASKIILGSKFSGRNFGKIHKNKQFLVLPLWHPAFVIRGGGSQRITVKKYNRHFKKITQFLSKKD